MPFGLGTSLPVLLKKERNKSCLLSLLLYIYTYIVKWQSTYLNRNITRLVSCVQLPMTSYSTWLQWDRDIRSLYSRIYCRAHEQDKRPRGMLCPLGEGNGNIVVSSFKKSLHCRQ